MKSREAEKYKEALNRIYKFTQKYADEAHNNYEMASNMTDYQITKQFCNGQEFAAHMILEFIKQVAEDTK